MMDLPNLPLECTCGERDYLKEQIKRREYIIDAIDNPNSLMPCGHKYRYVLYDENRKVSCAVCETAAATAAERQRVLKLVLSYEPYDMDSHLLLAEIVRRIESGEQPEEHDG